MSFKLMNQLETIDRDLENLNSQSLLMVGNILGQANLGMIDLGELAQLLGEIAQLPKSLQDAVLESIHAKIKAR